MAKLPMAPQPMVLLPTQMPAKRSRSAEREAPVAELQSGRPKQHLTILQLMVALMFLLRMMQEKMLNQNGAQRGHDGRKLRKQLLPKKRPLPLANNKIVLSDRTAPTGRRFLLSVVLSASFVVLLQHYI
ncbi:hypothetical protein JM93_04226 [Roseibium hamelinense]|uniref:Uncharacterized protein n=1 Tax=Roseibium hamelinense TaxID=150831 RepID=A0A562SEX7_9HYPH|nr:hypothetical protein JM93_04226 [Roseibium hamelinense]